MLNTPRLIASRPGEIVFIQVNRNVKAKTTDMKHYLNLIQTLYAVNHNSGISITESRPLQNVARENANKLEKRKKAFVTSHRPVNLTVNHVIPCLFCCFLLRQPKRSAIHR